MQSFEAKNVRQARRYWWKSCQLGSRSSCDNYRQLMKNQRYRIQKREREVDLIACELQDALGLAVTWPDSVRDYEARLNAFPVVAEELEAYRPAMAAYLEKAQPPK